MLYKLPSLKYKTDALEPHISRKTLELHHDKHHDAYVNNLNSLVIGTKYEDAEIESIIKVADGAVFNNAAQVWNHTFFFEGMTPGSGTSLSDGFSIILSKQFGSVQSFKEIFIKSALSLFGSGWVWLLWNPKGSLEIIQENNAGNPLRKGFIPIMNCDVWEHSYYLDYQNRKTEYLEAFWTLVNWEIIEKRYLKAREYNLVGMNAFAS
ncbi:MAG TPA: superoxide dismutase [Bacteroidales bacterium]|nr:superoxide dismutase [Bacteroidales bacterium]